MIQFSMFLSVTSRRLITCLHISAIPLQSVTNRRLMTCLCISTITLMLSLFQRQLIHNTTLFFVCQQLFLFFSAFFGRLTYCLVTRSVQSTARIYYYRKRLLSTIFIHIICLIIHYFIHILLRYPQIISLHIIYICGHDKLKLLFAFNTFCQHMNSFIMKTIY